MWQFFRRLISKKPTQALPNQVRGAVAMPFDGFSENIINSGYLENLSNEDLILLNDILPWKCFTADSKGRRFGSSAWKGKRDTPQQIPDNRIVVLNELFNLKGKSVLEVGCFEGIHTIGLAQFAAKVYAVDSRVENVVKTVVRSTMFGFQPKVFVCNLEEDKDVNLLPKVDVVHHVGVLYHLKDPIKNLYQLANIAEEGVLLDTHYATESMVNSTYSVNGREYSYFSYREKGRQEVFSGMYDHAKWLLLDDIKAILIEIGFTNINIHKDSIQRNGPRVTLYAFKRTFN